MNLAQALIAAMGGGFRLVTYSSSLNSANITVPAGGAVGDVLVLVDSAANFTSSYPASGACSGFTEVNNVFDTNGVDRWNRVMLYYQHAASDLSGTSVTGGMTGNALVQKLLLVFRGTSAFATATVLDADGQATTGNPTAQTITVNGQTAPILAIAASYAGTGITMSGASSVVHPNGLLSMSYRIYTTDPTADLTADTGDSAGNVNTLQSCYIQLTY